MHKYCENIEIAGSFENYILYKMCRDFPSHIKNDFRFNNAEVFSGKLLAIGRIYSASPERGGGISKNGNSSFFKDISEYIYNKKFSDITSLENKITELKKMPTFIDFAKQCMNQEHIIEPANNTCLKVMEIYEIFIELIHDATLEKRKHEKEKEKKSFRFHKSFASKYLHFHLPNYFPIMDKYSKKGVICKLKGKKPNKFIRKISCEKKENYISDYKRFCENVLKILLFKYDETLTLRSLDTKLVEIGRYAYKK